MTDYSEKDYELGREVEEAQTDIEIDDYIKYLLIDQATQRGLTQFDNVLIEWTTDLPSDRTIVNLVRLNLLAGEPEKAGKAMVESLQEYLTEIASDAVRERRE